MTALLEYFSLHNLISAVVEICTNSQAVKKGVALKNLGKKSCEIKSGGQEMAAMMLMLELFLPRLFKAAPFSQLGCFRADITSLCNCKFQSQPL